MKRHTHVTVLLSHAMQGGPRKRPAKQSTCSHEWSCMFLLHSHMIMQRARTADFLTKAMNSALWNRKTFDKSEGISTLKVSSLSIKQLLFQNISAVWWTLQITHSFRFSTCVTICSLTASLFSCHWRNPAANHMYKHVVSSSSSSSQNPRHTFFVTDPVSCLIILIVLQCLCDIFMRLHTVLGLFKSQGFFRLFLDSAAWMVLLHIPLTAQASLRTCALCGALCADRTFFQQGPHLFFNRSQLFLGNLQMCIEFDDLRQYLIHDRKRRRIGNVHKW